MKKAVKEVTLKEFLYAEAQRTGIKEQTLASQFARRKFDLTGIEVHRVNSRVIFITDRRQI